MAFTSILRKSGSSLAPLATRLVRGQRNYHRALFTAKTHSNLSHSHRISFLSPFLVPNLHYSSASKKPSSDETLLRVILSEIQCLQETDDHDRVGIYVILFYFFIIFFGVYGLFGCWESVGKWKENGTYRAIFVVFWEKMKNPPQCHRRVVFGRGKINNNLISRILISWMFTIFLGNRRHMLMLLGLLVD